MIQRNMVKVTRYVGQLCRFPSLYALLFTHSGQRTKTGSQLIIGSLALNVDYVFRGFCRSVRGDVSLLVVLPELEEGGVNLNVAKNARLFGTMDNGEGE